MAHIRLWWILILAFVSASVLGQVGGQKLTDGWTAYEKGFVEEIGKGKSGGTAFFCDNPKADDARGARYTLALNQSEATPFVISGWSKALGVNGSADDGYALYLDIEFTDGDHLWGTFASFSGGSHDWEQRKVRIVPIKPVKNALVYVLLRRHIGAAWFSDVTYAELGGKNSFDFQPIAAPTVSKDGWFLRDVAHGSLILPIAESGKLGLRAVASTKGANEGLEVFDKQGANRAITIYYCQKVDASTGSWWNTLRASKTIALNECGTLVSASSGANGLASSYPFAAVTKGNQGWMIAVPPSIGPRPFRLFYNPVSRLLCASFDVALTAENIANPSKASAEIMHGKIDPAWGFRDAARQYYAAFPDAFRSRIAKQGIWMPFTDPATISHPEDFGFSVHEGDNSVSSDASLGVLSFRYTEPMTWWMPMDPAIPRTYADALKILNNNLANKDAAVKKQAEAVLASGTYGSDGLYNVSFQNQPWANGAVWILNPNPGMPRSNGNSIQADIVFGLQDAANRYDKTSLSGEYLDSLEAHSEVLDYRRESLQQSSLPLSFDSGSFRPVVPQGFSTFEIARTMSNWLHGKGKLLFANSTPVNSFSYLPLLDCSGIEVNWLDGGNWSPDSDSTFCYRRTMSYHKPYMLLQNTDFSKFGSKEVAMYFKKCVFYGVFPSFFSADAATHPYWEDPKLYNRDRALFKSTIPVIQKLAAEGWEPVTNAWSSDPSILVERFGERTWTVFNEGKVPQTATVTFKGASKLLVTSDFLGGGPVKLTPVGNNTEAKITLDPGDCKVIRL